jgi:hypothetical protein
MKKQFLILAFLVPLLSFAQKAISDSNYIFWSKERRLQQSDFLIKVGNVSPTYSFAQFSLDCTINGVFGLPRDYKKKIRNYLIRSAFWVDTSYGVSHSIQYQQTLFDLAEIYVRQFRKAVF